MKQIDLVRVSGARLYTERAGDGPALVLIPGGGGDAGMYEAVVPLLATRFTVITFDRRGNSRSPLDGGPTPTTMAEQAADVAAILDRYAIDRAHVFGSSGGAIIALEFLARHGDRLLGAVVHEPPLAEILDGEPEAEAFDDLRRVAETEGALRAWVALAGMTMPRPPRILRSPTGRSLTASTIRAATAVWVAVRRLRGREAGGMERLIGNIEILMRSELPAFLGYEPDIAALRHVKAPWCLATGRESVGRPYHRPAHLLGAALGVPCEEFPGGHMPYQQRPEEFTTRLITILDRFP